MLVLMPGEILTRTADGFKTKSLPHGGGAGTSSLLVHRPGRAELKQTSLPRQPRGGPTTGVCVRMSHFASLIQP